MAIVAVVGAGMMGTALCWPLHDNNHEVHLVGTPLDEHIIQSVRKTGFHPKLDRQVPADIVAYTANELPQAVKGVQVIVNGVSSFGTNWFADRVGPLLQPDVPVLAVTKGLQGLPDGDLQPLPEYINSLLPPKLQHKISLNAIAGPCIAHELAARRQTSVVFCGKDDKQLQVLKRIFATSYYHIWTSTYLKEIEICAALKNGYALGVAIAVGQFDREGVDGLANMNNPQAAIFTQSVLEMRLLIKALGGDETHVSWLPGIGDLFVTVFGGRTRQLGRLLGQGYSASEALKIMADVTLESVEIITRVAGALEKLAKRNLVDLNHFPLIRFLYRVLHHDEQISFPWDEFYSPLTITDA